MELENLVSEKGLRELYIQAVEGTLPHDIDMDIGALINNPRWRGAFCAGALALLQRLGITRILEVEGTWDGTWRYLLAPLHDLQGAVLVRMKKPLKKVDEECTRL